MSWKDVQGFPRSGDITGEPNPGHRVEVIHAAVVVFPDGSEGLASFYTFNDGGEPVGRVTIVCSDPKVLPTFKQVAATIKPPEGGRIEWREYRLANPRLEVNDD